LTIRNSKLTLTNCLHVSWSATVPCVNTACVCGRKKLPFAEYSVVKERSSFVGGQAPKPPARSLAGARRPSSAPSQGTLSRNTEVASICLRRRPVGCASGPLFALARG
jgi:hypothetical protein